MSKPGSAWFGQFCWTAGAANARGDPYSIRDAHADVERRHVYAVCGTAAKRIVSATGAPREFVLCLQRMHTDPKCETVDLKSSIAAAHKALVAATELGIANIQHPHDWPAWPMAQAMPFQRQPKVPRAPKASKAPKPKPQKAKPLQSTGTGPGVRRRLPV